MTFTTAIASVFGKYAEFHGRARRSEFWWFTLFYVLVSVAVTTIDLSMRSPVLGGLVSLGFLLPSLAVEVRRLHDINKSGWWILIGLVPLVGIILLIVWWCQDGDVGENRFGQDPKPRSLPTGLFGQPPAPPLA